MSIYLNHPTYSFRVDLEQYPSGEWRWSEDNRNLSDYTHMSIYTTRIEEIIQAMFVADSFGVSNGEKEIYIPFLPGARQDRRMEGINSDKLRTLESVYDEISVRNFKTIYTLDLHNPKAVVGLGAFSAFARRSIMRTPIINKDMRFIQQAVKSQYHNKWTGIIAPDEGAITRATQAAEALEVPLVVEASKKRDTETGKITGFAVAGNLEPGNYLMVDDICDGGGTFIGLADEIKDRYAGVYLDLFVTHGIFSQGTEELSKRFDIIYTTNSTGKSFGLEITQFDLF